MAKHRIKPHEIALGSELPWDVFDANGRLLLSKGHVIQSANQIEALIKRGLFAEAERMASTLSNRVQSAPTGSAVSLIMDARRHLQIICGPANPHENFSEHILQIRKLITQACDLSEDATIATALLERRGRYSIRHSLDVAITCHVVGKQLGIEQPELTSTVCAALTMNLSILELQDTLQSHKGSLTEAQREIIRGHPEASVEILRELGVTDETWLGAVLSHHETVDGTGYRLGKKGDEISLPAQLVSLADVYCARISSRQYRTALRPNAALKALFLEQGKKVRQGLASQFIKAVGVFPAGTPVRLENGEIGIVTSRGNSPTKPFVCSVIGSRGMPLAVPTRRDTACPPFGVREVVEWSELGAVPSMLSLWGKIASIG